MRHKIRNQPSRRGSGRPTDRHFIDLEPGQTYGRFTDSDSDYENALAADRAKHDAITNRVNYDNGHQPESYPAHEPMEVHRDDDGRIVRIW